jgi:hypothetical protein
MKIPAVRKLLGTYSLEELQEAETQLIEEQPLAIEVEGDDEGEQLTHILGAIWCKQQVAEGSCSESEALRNFAQRVRKSID